MNIEYLNIYNNLIKLTRNKNLYLNLKNKDTFSDRLIILLLHFGFFLQFYKDEATKKDSQNLFDYVIKQIELSIREIGYGDATINKKMKDYVNLLFSIIDKIDNWELKNNSERKMIIENYINEVPNVDNYIEYFEKYRIFLTKNTFKNLTKDILTI